MSKRDIGKLVCFALCVVQHPETGKFLLVHETRNRGYWLPGGGVDFEETLEEAAVRETKEEAGIDIKVTGVLRFEMYDFNKHTRLRVIFYGTPIDNDQPPKSEPDSESLEAFWVDYDELKNYNLRGDELVEWGKYLRNGGIIHPIGNLFGLESSTPRDVNLDLLIHSSSNNDLELLKISIENGANVNFIRYPESINNNNNNNNQSNSKSALHISAENNSTDVAKFLIQNGAYISMLDLDAKTPLHVACENSSLEVAKLLLENSIILLLIFISSSCFLISYHIN
eukprot:TRINITY_DN6845_c0_g1_i1.p1 TRINITY_DN6845_c0_g1~~TRINITY_DN6845_c0_g1_i1.p1  ORF type:complete len:283 (-),score=73.07 TRINITY_DN6845_c0_g1_i1:13-861(-)